MAQAALAHDTDASWQVQARSNAGTGDNKHVRAVKPQGGKGRDRLAALATAFHGGQQQRALETGIFG